MERVRRALPASASRLGRSGWRASKNPLVTSLIRLVGQKAARHRHEIGEARMNGGLAAEQGKGGGRQPLRP
jgi:hypothetical protein